MRLPMSRLSIIIHLTPEALGARKRLFERFREAASERLRRLFPEAGTICRAGASVAIDVTVAPGEPSEDEGRAEAIREQVAAVLEELLVEDDSWWDEEERRRSAAETETFPEPFADARDWIGPETEQAEDAVPEEEWSARIPASDGLPDSSPASDYADPLAPPAPNSGEPADAEKTAGNPAPGFGRPDRPKRSADPADPSIGEASHASSDSLPADSSTEKSAENPLEGGALCRVGRAWAALFPRHGLSVRLEERDGGRVAGLVTRLLPGAAPSMAAWKRLQGGRTRVVAWDKAPPEIVAALLDALRRETDRGRS